MIEPGSNKVKVGDRAPNFTLPTQSGGTVTLRDFEGKKAVVLFFYPGDDTPVCTAEACSFRDRYEAFRRAGAEVIGVSANSVASHKRFAERHNLPFHLVSDEGKMLRKRYGVPKTLFFLDGRVTYVIDKKGIVRYRFSSQFRPAAHVQRALKILEQIQNEP